MRLRLDATPAELSGKADELVKALAREVRAENPTLADNLEKALPAKEPALKYRTLRDLHDENKKVYRATLDRMIGAVEDILQEPQLHKSATLATTGCSPLQDLPAQPIPEIPPPHPRIPTLDSIQAHPAGPQVLPSFQKAEPQDPDYDPETGDPIVDPATGLSPSEAADEPTEEPEAKSLRLSQTPVRRAQKPLDEPVAHDHTRAIHDADKRLYGRVRGLVAKQVPGVKDSDFDAEAGRFYGWSTNQLLDWLGAD